MDESTFPTSRAHDPTTDAQRPDPNRGRLRRILPWIIAAVAALAAAVAIGVLLIDRSSEPRSVAQLAAQSDPPAPIVLDEEFARESNLTADDFVSYGSYGDLGIWSTTELEEARCLALVVENRISVFNCSAPTLDTVADFNIESSRIPPAPSGERTSQVRFVLHDEMVDVYLAPRAEGGFY